MPNIWMDVDTALPEVPVNIIALTDDSDFVTREESVTFNQAGMDLVWNFVSTAGIHSQTEVTPTDTAGDYDWVNQGNGMYTIEIPLSGGASINNDAEGFGWFSGFATGILPWSGPVIGFRAAGLNNLLVDNAFSATRGLTGTALPAVAANANNGIVTGDGSVTFTAGVGNRVAVDAEAISGDTTAADNLELQFDTTGLVGDTFPLRQDQGASISGGLAVQETATSVTTIAGSEQGLANTSASNNTYWTGDDDGAGAEFIFRFVPSDTDASPGDLQFEGFYNEPGGPFTNSATLETYNFLNAQWDVQETLTNAAEDQVHDNQLSKANASPGSDTIEGVAVTIGDVLVKFQQTSQETGNAVLNIDRITVGFISSPVTASEIVDEWETQSQADPTGFHVNLQEWIGVAPLALSSQQVQTDMTAIHGAALTETPGQLATRFTAFFDQAASTFSVNTALSSFKATGFNTVVPDVAGTAAGLHGTTDGLVAGLENLSSAGAQAAADAALVANHLDRLFKTDYDPASKPGVATALLNELVEDDSGVSRYTVNALENAPSGSGASAETIADAVWEEAQADHVVVGSFGIIASEIAAIKTKTDGLNFTGSDVKATLDGETVVTDGTSRTASKADVSALALEATVDTVKTDTAAILLDTGTDGVVVASGSKTGYKLASDGVDLVVIESGMNLRQAMAANTAALVGVLSGAATTTITILGGGVATTRIVATVDADGNRSALTLTLPA